MHLPLFRAPLTNEERAEEATEFADPPDGDALREELKPSSNV